MRHRGFSLVELSIVLVILGLLVGGVLSGQSLIRASQLRSVTRELDQYRTAMYGFRDKYFYLPGDIPNASQFWRPADNGDGEGLDCTPLLMTVADKTCNGDGNGQILEAWDEWMMWQHMVFAGLIEGQYFYPNGSFAGKPGINFPATRLGSRSGWNACYTVHGNYGRGAQNMLTLATIGWSTGPCVAGHGADLNSAEAWSIDTKIDDGIAGNGRMTAEDSMEPGYTNCTSSGFGWSNPATTYVLTNTMHSCRLFFPIK